MNRSDFTFIDLFCGIGGFHQALESLGGNCVFACDIDKNCRETYAANYGLMPAEDITKIAAEDIPAHDVLCAGFPCQAFSKAGQRLGFKDQTKGTLFFDVLRILRHHRPPYALLENVRNLASHDNGRTWCVIHSSLREAGYNLLPNPVIFSPHYLGIPQHRERVFIMCVREDVGSVPPFRFNAQKLPESNISSILQDESEIENLKKYQLTREQNQLLELWDEFIRSIKIARLPGFPIWTDCFRTIHEDISDLPAWKQNFIRKNSALYHENAAFIDDWLKRAKACPLFFGAKAKLEWQAGQTNTPSLFDNILQFRPSGIRVKPPTYFPALVAITQTSIVGSRRRQLTERECARLQSFPETFRPDANSAQAYKQFGNAVNVEVVRLFARYLFGDADIRAKYAEPAFSLFAV